MIAYRLGRREFLAAAGALAAAKLAIAQAPGKELRIGVLLVSSNAQTADRAQVQPLFAGLRQRGYEVGKNLAADVRVVNPARLKDLGRSADELIARKPDVLVGSEFTGAVLKGRTSTIPIVLLISADPVSAGLVESLARPGTNVTGMAGLLHTLVGKQMELLAELVPGMSRIALLAATFDPPKGHPYYGRPDSWKLAAEQAAQARGLALELLRVDKPESVLRAFEAYSAQGLVVAADVVVLRMIEAIAGEIRKRRIPAISGYAEFAVNGGLMGYGASIEAAAQYAAGFVERIFKGAKPADLPVEQVSRYNLAINLKAAKALGLTVPQPLLLRADRVIN